MDDVALIVKFRAIEGREADLERVLMDAVEDAPNDPGVVQFILHRVPQQPREFVLYERFRSAEALAERRQRPSTVAMREALDEVRESAEDLVVMPLPSPFDAPAGAPVDAPADAPVDGGAA